MSTIRINRTLPAKGKMLQNSEFSRTEFISISKRDSQEVMILLLLQSQLNNKISNLIVYPLSLASSRWLKIRKYSWIQ
jgi:hypothetical protein